MDKKQAKKEIEKLIADYERIKSSGKIKSYTEESTKKDFILPLFKALGWNVNKDEVSAEEYIISSGRVDYGFYINGRAKFYLEAKPLRADLNIEDFAKQAIRYSFNRGITWAVLTDFEGIKIFNAQSLSTYLGDKLYFEINYSDYLNRFDKLWELSKESFENEVIDKKAEEAGKKLQKIPITELLYKDLNDCRKILTDILGKWNPNVPKNFLDEGVQKLLDRLLFIKVAEDRKIENNVLVPLINQWRLMTGSNKPTLYQSMTKKFRELDDIYNSNIFKKHPFEEWEESGDALEEVLKILNGKKGYYEYDFSIMPADILGSVYENYLGYKLSQSQKGLTLHKDAGKRKEQGIYYTPTYIVDYIVRNALKPVLDKCKSVNDLKKIKVLDPACGSGSFLIKALEVILEKYKEFNYEDTENLRIQIILGNIYGVDLDEQAVEIARLNLLINALEQRSKLPSLENNIKNGNSLISGTDEALEKYFGKSYRDKKPFNWKEEFPEVFKLGGFDVVIGNPPWVFTRGENFTDNEKEYFDGFLVKLGLLQNNKGRNIQSGKLNLYSLFILKGIELLKTNGELSFIVPNNILRTTTFDIIRKFILDSTEISEIDDLGSDIFHGVTASSVILFLIKNLKKDRKNNIKVISSVVSLADGNYKEHLMQQENFYDNPSFTFNILSNDISSNLSHKLIENTDSLGSISKYIIEGIVGSIDKDVFDKKEGEMYKPFLVGKDIGKYETKFKNKWIVYDRNRLHRARPEEVFLSEKILVQRISGGLNPLTATLDREKYYTFASINNILLKEDVKYKIEYVLGVLNSKLMNWFYSTNFSNRSELTVNISKTFLSKIPVKKLSINDQKILVNLVNKILILNKDLVKIPENSNKWNSVKLEIEKTDKKINEEIYKLYGLTMEEIKIVEKN
jgi:adenine-specific DNA-methyltransferase